MNVESNKEFGTALLLGDQSKLFRGKDLITSALVEHGPLSRLDILTSIPELQSVETLIEAWDSGHETGRVWSPASGKAFQMFATNKSQLRNLYNNGFAVVMERVERYVPALSALCVSLERDLGVGQGQVNVQAFCARAGGRGRAHFDSGFNFNCQLQGLKTWKLKENTGVRFPHMNMFLGTHACEELQRIFEGPLPDSIEDGQTFQAKPGTVVFVPNGLLHETLMDTDSLAICFAIDTPESIALSVADQAKKALLQVPELRAPRTKAQRVDIVAEVRTAAETLRKLADQIESGNAQIWPKQEKVLRRRQGLSFTRDSDDSVTISSDGASKTISIGQTPASLLQFAMKAPQFTLGDLVSDPSASGLTNVNTSLEALVRHGLLEVVD